MNHNTDTPENDLPQDKQISQAYQSLDKETTPPALDEHLLAAARREVRSRPQQVSFSRRWAVPISVAAVIVLSVSLFTMQQTPLPVTPASAPAPASIGVPAEPRMEEQAIQSDSVETKQETLMKQRSVAKPLKSDMPEADIADDKDNMVSGVKMFEAAPVLEKEKATTPSREKEPAEAMSTEEQLAMIRRLLEQGKEEEALTVLQAFQERYPDYPLSDDLKKLVAK